MDTSIDWYFDFVSPYSYICFNRLNELPGVTISYKPVLFAGLLEHWGQKGPAEIGAKRKWTYRWCTWWARELGITFRFPGHHPFNPLPYLRLAIAAGPSERVVRRIFDILWTTGDEALDESILRTLAKEFGVDDAKLTEAKEGLRKATAEAARRGVFGVPTFVIDGEVFWGADALDFLKAFLKDEAVLRNAEMRRVDNLPVGAVRKGS
jgi:2-hydroxychromene-2-carboxylate isomerase